MSVPGAVPDGQITPHFEPAELLRRGEAASQRQVLTHAQTTLVQSNRHAATTKSYKLAHQHVFLRYHHKVSIQEGNEKVCYEQWYHLLDHPVIVLMAGYDVLQ